MCARTLFHCWPERKRLKRHMRLSCVKLDVDETEKKRNWKRMPFSINFFF